MRKHYTAPQKSTITIATSPRAVAKQIAISIFSCSSSSSARCSCDLNFDDAHGCRREKPAKCRHRTARAVSAGLTRDVPPDPNCVCAFDCSEVTALPPLYGIVDRKLTVERGIGDCTGARFALFGTSGGDVKPAGRGTVGWGGALPRLNRIRFAAPRVTFYYRTSPVVVGMQLIATIPRADRHLLSRFPFVFPVRLIPEHPAHPLSPRNPLVQAKTARSSSIDQFCPTYSLRAAARKTHRNRCPGNRNILSNVSLVRR
jgi:hypothetical protein